MPHIRTKRADGEIIDSEAGCGLCVLPGRQFLWLMPSGDKRRRKSCWVPFVVHWSATAGADTISFVAFARYAGRI